MRQAATDITYRTYYKWLPKESLTNIDDPDSPPASGRDLSMIGNKKGLAPEWLTP